MLCVIAYATVSLLLRSSKSMQVVAGIDLGGTAVNYTFLTAQAEFLIEGLFEHPSLAREGPAVCLQQIAEGLILATEKAGISAEDIVFVGLDTPGPASSTGVLSAKGSTNFVHPDWAAFDIRQGLTAKLLRPVTYLNDGNAGALWGHFVLFGEKKEPTSVSAIIGTGLGGGVILNGAVITGRKGFGGELGHVLIPYQAIKETEGMRPECNCGRTGDLESLCSLTAIANTLLPFFLKKSPAHSLNKIADVRQAAKLVRGMAEEGDPLCREVFRIQAQALGLFFDQMVNTFDPDVLIVGGGAIETGLDFQKWFVDEIRAGMPAQRDEQADIPISIMPNGDTAGARGAAIQALMEARRTGFQ